MADRIDEATAALARALAESPEMARMRELEGRVQARPEAAARMRAYLEAQAAYAAHPTAEGAAALSRALEEAKRSPEIVELMAAQQALLARVQRAQEALWRAIGVEPETGCNRRG
ncbi:MAG: hypothetical protein D6739_08450 [Nitrospirae bacterium]|nr:MAG: hypothetical protein D6739_08450 [Nitrospirota bacterium]